MSEDAAAIAASNLTLAHCQRMGEMEEDFHTTHAEIRALYTRYLEFVRDVASDHLELPIA